MGKIKVNELQNGQSEEIAPTADELINIMEEAMRYTRELTSDLKPPPSMGNDIRASIKWVAEKVETRGLAINIDDDEQPKPLDDELRSTVVQSVRELLFNVIKHTSEEEATVRLRRSEQQLQITVEDQGEGFNPEKKEWASAKDDKFGLFNIRERIDLLGGRVDIDSEVGRGTEITLSVPLSKNDSDSEKVEPDEKGGQGKQTITKQTKQGEKLFWGGTCYPVRALR